MVERNSLQIAVPKARLVAKMIPETPRRQPVHPSIDEKMIRTLVHRFYAKVRDDSELGPIFARVIGDDWDAHLAKMCDFWSSVMLTTGRYKGNPMIAHMQLKAVLPRHFERWLTLFRQTAQEVCPPENAVQFIGRSENIARSLQLGMFFQPKSKASGISLRRGLP
jgi:hemoglobin